TPEPLSSRRSGCPRSSMPPLPARRPGALRRSIVQVASRPWPHIVSRWHDGPMQPESAGPDVDTFGATGVLTHFRGPYADGPPPAALEVRAPRLDRFGPAEIGRLVVIVAVLVTFVLRALPQRLVLLRRGSW